MNAKLPAWYMHLMLSVRQIGLDKGKTWIDNNTGYWFSGIGKTLRRLFWNEAFSTHEDFFRKISEPYQLAMGTPAGGQTIALGTALLMEKYPVHVFIQDDMESILGTAKRKTGVDSYLADSCCSQWHQIADIENNPIANTHIQDGQGKLTQAPWSYGEGGELGATATLFTPCAAIQPYLRRLDETLRPHSGSARRGIEKRRWCHPRTPRSLVASHRGLLQGDTSKLRSTDQLFIWGFGWGSFADRGAAGAACGCSWRICPPLFV